MKFHSHRDTKYFFGSLSKSLRVCPTCRGRTRKTLGGVEVECPTCLGRGTISGGKVSVPSLVYDDDLEE